MPGSPESGRESRPVRLVGRRSPLSTNNTACSKLASSGWYNNVVDRDLRVDALASPRHRRPEIRLSLPTLLFHSERFVRNPDTRPRRPAILTSLTPVSRSSSLSISNATNCVRGSRIHEQPHFLLSGLGSFRGTIGHVHYRQTLAWPDGEEKIGTFLGYVNATLLLVC